VLASACPRRHVAPRVVYLETAQQQPSARLPASGTLVIQEPPPPLPLTPPAQSAPPEQKEEPEPETPERRSHVRPRPRPDESAPATQPAGEVPALELGGSAAQQAARERSLADLQRQIRQRIDRLSGLRLPDSTKRILGEAGSFLTQSETALKEGDTQRAENLAHKAELLLDALERH
jgi:hypothetical protein